MHDDDDTDPEMGRLIHPEFGVEPSRAEYGLAPGESALEGFGPEFEIEVDANPRWTRRQLFTVLAVTGVGASSGITWGLSLGGGAEGASGSPKAPAVVQDPIDPQTLIMLNGARSMASKPIEELVRVNFIYINMVANHGGSDRALWNGMKRLAAWAVADRGIKGVEIARRMTKVFENREVPASMVRLRFELEALLIERKRLKR